MRANNNLLFNVPKKKGVDENDIKISIMGVTGGEEQKQDSDFENMQIAIQSLNVGTWTLDLSTNSLLMCNRCRQIVQVCSEENINVGRLSDLIPAGYGQKMMETVLLALKAATPFDVEVPIVVAKDSRPKWLRITGAGFFKNQIFTNKIHGTVEDISERKNGEFLKEDFLAIVSHDLRSPLSVIKLYLQLCDQLAGDISNDRISEMLKKAGVQVHKMTSMIQCYLESSVIASGKISCLPTSFDVEKLLKEVISDLYLIYPGRILFLKPGPSIEVCADRDKIAQVIQNLLSNAIKYSSRIDVITIHFKKVRNYLQVAVKDHGIGIKLADQKKVFDRFYRVDNESGRTVKGYGIGLYLSKEIIKQHNGDIWLKSEVNRGTSFYFTLPLF